MSSYTEIDTALLDLDFTNPRIQNYLQNYPEESRSGELLAMLLGTGTDSCASLKESIKEHGGIINPIIVNHFPDGRYVVIEGNTRLQIYRDFIRDNVPGNWNKIRAIIYENLENNEMHSIRLQAHLVGPRDWDAYAKAKYLTFLSDEEKMPMKELLAYCGGSSKASEIRYMIQAYKDMRDIYAPLCEDDTQFDQKKFSGFVELQKKNVVESLQLHGYDKTDFAQWMVDEKFSRLEDVRRLPQILNSKRARQAFLKHDTAAAKKILEAEDITPDSLKNVTYEMLANELSKRMFDIIVETILSSKPGYKVIAGILENLGEKVCTDLLKKIDLFSGHDNDKLTMLIKANKSKRLVDFDFSLLQFIPYFHVSNLLSKQEEQIIMNSAYELKEAPIRKILLLHLDELKDVLIKTNGAQPGDTQIISVIEEQIKELYHQISIFEL